MDEPGRQEPHLVSNPYADPNAGAGAAAAVTPPTAAGQRSYAVEFTASAGEYFRIWIVNLALTIITLGIYSAWAKVRKKRYFYGHTKIDGDSFEYRGNPVAILKGRFIAVGALALFYGVRHFAPSFQWALFVAAAFIVPWLLVRSLAFNAYNTAYRNIRLHFRGTYPKCLKLIIGYGLLTLATAGIGYAFLRVRLTEFVIRNHHYGSTRFEAADLKKLFFNVYAKAIGLGLLLMVALIAMAAGNVAVFGRSSSSAVSVGITVIIYAGYLVIFAYLRARITNATWNSISMGPVHFECLLRARDLFWLYLVNIVAIIVTLGLATPWAAVRTMRYRADKMTVLASGGMGSFVAAESAQVSAAGEEVGEMFDIDFGL
jgi:uncharacterized membrane protein YjgN (DUF898 family)